MNLIEIAKLSLQSKLKGRYVTNEHILPFLESLPQTFNLKIEGKSVLDKNIYSLKVGTGATKIYIWSQMHGNESTTTKAIIDFLAFLNSNADEAIQILEYFTLYIIPILNPDGAENYTRVNANQVDLNRDSVDLSQPESKILRKCFDEFEPDFAFNMHDQRTLFAAGNQNKPATISFLAPSYNMKTEINEVRTIAMQIISEIYTEISKYIPNQIGRFDDAFNLNCIGDFFTSLGVPTILFEAGHFQNDYTREETRKIVFVALLKSIFSIKDQTYLTQDIKNYFNIPENQKLINDILLKNINVKEGKIIKKRNLGIQYKEVLKSKEISFIPIFDNELIENHQFGHLEVDASDFEITKNVDICDLLNEMNLKRADNGVFDVKYLLKY